MKLGFIGFGEAAFELSFWIERIRFRKDSRS